VQSPFLINAGVAVLAFFVISGFYMALVINEKYKTLPDWRRRFLLNRALRLLPVYFVILFSIVLIETLGSGSNQIASYLGANSSWKSFLVLLNFTIVGQDFFMWLRDSGITTVANPVLIQPAWSIASEILFYVVAAFTFSSKRGIILTFVAAAAMSWVLTRFSTPPTRLPLETFIYFAAGGVSYLIYRVLRRAVSSGGYLLMIIPISAISFVFLHYDGFQAASAQSMMCLGAVTALSIPLLFLSSKNIKADAFLGDLSYPLYLVHVPAYQVILTAIPGTSLWIVTGVSMLISWLLVRLIDKPMDRLMRSKIASDSQGNAELVRHETALAAPNSV
jgi:peptidoglycan/LPS O-acetylase OafA/YrhL